MRVWQTAIFIFEQTVNAQVLVFLSRGIPSSIAVRPLMDKAKAFIERACAYIPCVYLKLETVCPAMLEDLPGQPAQDKHAHALARLFGDHSVQLQAVLHGF